MTRLQSWSRSTPYICQRVTDFIRHIMENLHYFVANYVDDFMGLEVIEVAWSVFNALGNLLRDLGVSESVTKAIQPKEIIEFLGVWFDLRNMTISITPDRRRELRGELSRWLQSRSYNQHQLESLLGKLQFVANCIRPGRVMVLRLRNALWETRPGVSHISVEMRKDLLWWHRFMDIYNGVSVMWMEQVEQIDQLISTDACLMGVRGMCGNQFFHHIVLQNIVDDDMYTIAHVEFLAVLLGIENYGGTS